MRSSHFAFVASRRATTLRYSWNPQSTCVSPILNAEKDRSSASDEFRGPLGVEGLDALLEVIRLAETAVAMAFQFDRDRQRRILGVVQELLRRSLGHRREGAKLIDKLVGHLLEFGIGHAFGDDAPVKCLLRRDAFRTHHDVLGTGDSDHLLQARRAARTGYLPELLFRQRVKRGFGSNPEVASQRQFEADAEAIAAVRDD